MKVNEAREVVKAAVLDVVHLFDGKGFEISASTYYCDKNLNQITEFDQKVILLFGSIKIGLADMESDEYCTYALCCEVKAAMVDDEELTKEIENFKRDVQELIDKLMSAPSKKQMLLDINASQEREAEKSFEEFNAQMRKMKLKLYCALGVLAIIAAGILIFSLVV
ncbi:MAG: hypothetical protein J6Q68_00515 [Clostridia bacterium]|nr:hypothetical protein [Clostridia bacterium]